MIRPAVAAMYRRRGSLVGWLHATPPPTSTIDPLTGGPIASLGLGVVAGVGKGNFGETYLPAVNVWAYFSNKTTSFSQQGYGVVDIGDAQIDFAVPYVQANGSSPLLDANPAAVPPVVATAPSLSDYNKGHFAIIQNQQTIALDRFVIMEQLWQAKAIAVPVTDRNVVVAWRLLISKVSV